jgi:hemoglobin-like flavoprotein
MSHNQIHLAEASYHRCADNEAFYNTLYGGLLASDPRIPPMFAGTEFHRQHQLLRHALGLLIIYAKRPNPALLSRIAERHHEVGITADLYPYFVESLVRAVAEHDPEYTADLGDAWRTSLAPGIAFMLQRRAGGAA